MLKFEAGSKVNPSERFCLFTRCPSNGFGALRLMYHVVKSVFRQPTVLADEEL
jgi:hypothetical protein